MFLPLVLAASMMMVSDRANFWDGDSISLQTQFGDVNEQGITKFLEPQEIERFAGKNVLVLVHGLATVETCYPYFTIQTNLLGDGAPYDEIIGYIWPCYATPLAYLEAKKHADKVAPRFKEFLTKLQPIAARVDVAAHSLGNRLVLQSLAFSGADPNLVTNFLSIAPAVDNEAIEKGEEFFSSTMHCANLYIFFSERDDVLKYAYPISEWDKALGYDGAEHPNRLPPNVQMVNCTAIVDSHDGYLFSKPIFHFISQTASMLVPGPQVSQTLQFTTDGLYQIPNLMMTKPFWNPF